MIFGYEYVITNLFNVFDGEEVFILKIDEKVLLFNLEYAKIEPLWDKFFLFLFNVLVETNFIFVG